MNKKQLEEIIFRLMVSVGEKTERGLSLCIGKSENYINICKNRGSISLKALMKICEEKRLDYNYILSGVRSDQLVQLKDDEMVIKKSEWETLNIKYQEAREIAMGKKTEKNTDKGIVHSSAGADRNKMVKSR